MEGGSSGVKEGEEPFPFPSSSQGHCASSAHEIPSFLACVADPWKKWVQERTGARGRHACLPRAPRSFLRPLLPSADSAGYLFPYPTNSCHVGELRGSEPTVSYVHFVAVRLI